MDQFADLFKNLAGEWKLTRDFSSGECFNGIAKFKAVSENRLHLCESGNLQIQHGSIVSASRNWIWEYNPYCELVIAYAEEPLRVYHSVMLKFSEHKWYGSADHLCSPDTYKGEYIICKNQIEINQTVSGPKKSYTLSSLYTRNIIG